MRKRRKFAPEFKAKVALEALAGELSLSELAAKHDVVLERLRGKIGASFRLGWGGLGRHSAHYRTLDLRKSALNFLPATRYPLPAAGALVFLDHA
jgi:transposase-like protein